MTEPEYKLTLPERLRSMSDNLSEACSLLAEAADEIERLHIKAMPQSAVYISDAESLAAINARRANQGLPPL